MPIYTYRRDDGTTFEIRQKFSDEALMVDPETGQSVTRVVHAAGIVFKGSGFYVNDSKGSKKANLNGSTNGVETAGNAATSSDGANTSGEKTGEATKAEATKSATTTKTETKKSSEPAAD